VSRPDKELRALIRSAGLRCTASRLAVLRVLEAEPVARTHAEVAEELPTWDRATLYRNLADLTRAGLLRRVDLGDHLWRFRAAEVDHEHPHFVCVDCGGVTCLPSSSVRVQRRSRSVPRALSRSEVEIQLHGRCDDCG